MKLIFFVFVICLLSQREIKIFNVPEDNVVAMLELEVIKNTFKLYNVFNASDKLKYKLVFQKNFKDVFDELDKAIDINYSMSMYQITITKEREKKYNFSIPYIPIKESIYTLKERDDKSYQKEGVKIAYQSGTTQEKQINLLKKYKIVPIAYTVREEKIAALRKNDVDFAIGDNIEIWGTKDLVLVKDMNDQPGNGLGFMFAKGSTLRDKLNPYVKKYIASQSFFNYLIKNFGKNVADYYKENLKH